MGVVKSIVVVFFVLFAFSCSQKQSNEFNLNISESQWRLLSIDYFGEAMTVSGKEHHRADAYILSFKTDTSFELSTSVNGAVGCYSIGDRGSIIITSYMEVTSMGTMDNDEALLNSTLGSAINKVVGYTVKRDLLFLEGEFGVIKFVRI